MEFAAYYFTLLVMLASVLAAATCFSAYLVSRARTMLWAFAAFLCYFVDVAIMLQDSIAAAVLGAGVEADATYLLMRSVATIVVGDALLTFFWLTVCEYAGRPRRAMLFAPPVVFFVISTALLFAAHSPEGRFWFYSLRIAYVAWSLGYWAFRYLTAADASERQRLGRGRMVFWLIAAFVALVVAEDAVQFLALGGASWRLGPVEFTAERNYSENLMMLACAALAVWYAGRLLALRFEKPPVRDDEELARQVKEHMVVYGSRHQLTDREREVLEHILHGKDNQNIASSMSIALSTVKVYVHRLLKKTSCENRQELAQDFWREL